MMHLADICRNRVEKALQRSPGNGIVGVLLDVV